MWTELRHCRTFAALHPERELDVYRMFLGDRDGRAVICDFGCAAEALEYWRDKAGEADIRVLDYRRLVSELDHELMTRLTLRYRRDTAFSANGQPTQNHPLSECSRNFKKSHCAKGVE